MKFLFEFVTCSGSCSSEAHRSAEKDNTLLVVEKRRRRVGRKQGKAKKNCGSTQWRPSLLSISEDVMKAESRIHNIKRPGWMRRLKTKVSSIFQRDRSRSFDHDDGWRPPIPAMVMAAPFMF